MGEMVSVSKTLGVAHPPGYPAYALAGKISTFLPFATPSYRVNLLSVLGGALSALLLYWTVTALGAPLLSALSAALFWIGASGTWTVSVVTEMYSLNLAAALLILLIAARLSRPDDPSRSYPDLRPEERSVTRMVSQQGFQFKFPSHLYYLLFFLLGLFCGVRLDLVLLGAGVAVFSLYSLRNSRLLDRWFPFFVQAGAFFALGFSIYLYLWIRSSQLPYLNWRSPDTLLKLFETLSRKSHGGTLDLLSVNYKAGELFFTDLFLYLKDMGDQFWWAGLPLVIAGLVRLYQINRAIFFLTFTAWIFAGPFFIYKANMPPNPHAYAILEPHFLLPNVMAAVWIGMGIAWLPGGKAKGLIALLLVAGIAARWDRVSKRENFIGYDYSRNLYATLPFRSILVMQKDVQLFLFWARHYADGHRPDVAIVARGLSGSDWYQAMRKRSGETAYIGPLKTEADWAEMIARNPGRKLFAGWDQDVPPSTLYRQIPDGLARAVVSVNQGGTQILSRADFLKEFYVYRGRYRYTEQNEFFSSDLIDDYSKAHFARGVERSLQNPADPVALSDWNRCIVLNSDNPQPYYRRGFAGFANADYPGALRDFERSERLHETLFAKTQDYHSLPEVVNSVKTEWAEVLLNLGVAHEKAGDRERSEAAYLKTLRVKPDFARAHYNIAVLYWNRDWAKAVLHLQEALRIDPTNPEARAYLPKAILALERSRGKS